MSRTIVVTGGAGGIGRCIVEYFASQGDAVYFVDCDVQGVHTQMERMRGYGWQVTGYAGDVAEKQVLEDLPVGYRMNIPKAFIVLSIMLA